MKQKGVTLIELVMMMVVLGILLPVVMMPIMQMSKGMGTTVEASGLSATARKHMEEELAAVEAMRLSVPLGGLGTWPPNTAVAANPATRTFTDVLNNRTYTTTIAERYCDSTAPLAVPPCSNITGSTNPSSANNYLIITVTTTSPSGGAIIYETMKVVSTP
jgi:type II secretory pathway pseudopilin PulG